MNSLVVSGSNCDGPVGAALRGRPSVGRSAIARGNSAQSFLNFRRSLPVNLAHVAAGLFIILPFGLAVSGSRQPWSSQALTGQQEQKLKEPAFIAEGAKLFLPNCSSAYCHGSGGKGGGAPGLHDKGLEAEYLFKTISNGISGSPMRAFKSELSEEKIWQLVAYIMSPAKAGDMNAAAASGTAPIGTAAPASKSVGSSAAGDPIAGKLLFFDDSQQKSCQSCHSFQGMGASISPDLSKLEARSARDVFLAIVMPGDARDERYRTVTITVKNGEKIIGIKKEEDADSIRVYDVSELPAVLRTVQKSEIAATEIANASAMPSDYAKIYTLKQLLDIVTFLKSGEKKAIQLKDILDAGGSPR
jgi:putative heme-binding domain-containing protein